MIIMITIICLTGNTRSNTNTNDIAAVDAQPGRSRPLKEAGNAKTRHVLYNYHVIKYPPLCNKVSSAFI